MTGVAADTECAPSNIRKKVTCSTMASWLTPTMVSAGAQGLALDWQITVREPAEDN